MFEVALTIVFSVLLTACIILLLKRSNVFVTAMLCLMTVSPLMQYVIYPVYGEYLRDTNFQKMVFELLLVGLLLAYIFKHNLPLRQINQKSVRYIFLIIAAWIILHIPNVVVSLDPQKSFIFMIISTVGPGLLFYILMNERSYDFSPKNILQSIYLVLIFAYGVSMVMYYYQLSKIGFIYIPNYLRNKAGIFGTNTGINIMALFIPAVIYPFSKKIRKTVLLRKGAFVGVLYSLIASLSRLGMVAISLLYIIFSFNSLKRFIILIIVIITIGIAVNQVLESLEVDLVEAVLFRFQGYGGDTSEKVLDDERFRLWADTFRRIKQEPQILFFGKGMGSYYQATGKYSNAHNLFVNLLYERGLIIWILFVIIIGFYVCLLFILGRSNLLDEEEKDLIATNKWGFILFFLYANFANDLFLASGFQSGMPAYFLFFQIGIAFKYYLIVKERRENRKLLVEGST